MNQISFISCGLACGAGREGEKTSASRAVVHSYHLFVSAAASQSLKIARDVWHSRVAMSCV